MDKLEKIWKDPVGSKVIGALILSFLATIGGIISTGWTKKGFFSILNIEIPLWILLIAIALYLLFLLLWNKYIRKDRHPSFLEYTEQADICGYDWVWNWKKTEEGKYVIYNIHPLCSICRTPLRIESIYSHNYVCSQGHTVASASIHFCLAASDIQDRIMKKYHVEALKYFKYVDYTY